MVRAKQGAAFYDSFRQRLDARAAVYAVAVLRRARCNALSALVRAGGYSRVHGSARFTGWDLLMDAVGCGHACGARGRRKDS